jgi:hypothetical protein
MKWVVAGFFLVVFGYVLRRILRLDVETTLGPRLRPLDRLRDDAYRPVALELDTQIAILGISLNEAFAERDSGNPELAWRLVGLALSEWSRMSEILDVLLNGMTRYMPTVRVGGPVRSMVATRFKSRVMFDYVRMHEMLNQIVFRSKQKFQLHVRVLRRAVENLTSDFRQLCRSGEQIENRADDLWQNFDFEFHDFDLIVKEILLAYRAFLASLPDSEVVEFAADLSATLPRGVRSETWALVSE